MSTEKIENVGTLELKRRQKDSKNVSSTPIRVRQKTKIKLDLLVKQANKNRVGKKVKSDDLIWFSLSLINDEHIESICASTLSNKNRMEQLYLKLSKDKRSFSREEFYGLLLDGKLKV
jgi:hypothetical protein